MEKAGKYSDNKHLVRESVRDIGAISLSITLQPLSVTRLRVGCLLDSSHKSGIAERKGIEIVERQPEFVTRGDGCKLAIVAVYRLIVGNNFEDALVIVFGGNFRCRWSWFLRPQQDTGD
jgi:hypothetical protein